VDGVASVVRGGVVAHIRREAPVHALMLGVMVVAMLTHSALASIAGAVLLVAVSVPCAALSRVRLYFRAHVLDLWAMALVLLVFLPQHAVVGHHAMAVPAGAAFAGIAVAWAGARFWLGTAVPGARRVTVASGGLTALGLAAMAVICSV